MTETAPVVRYRFVQYGGGVEELDRLGVRDRIRSGDIEGHTELALVGSDEWRAASTFPEFARYFELAAVGTRRVSGQYVVAPSKPREIQSMGQRLIAGLLYPLAGGEVVTLLGIAVFSMIPFIGWLAGAASVMIMLEIIRKSADGSTKMPAMVDTSNLGELVRVYLRVAAVTFISLAPILAAGTWSIFVLFTRSAGATTVVAIMALASALAAIYYPACLATTMS
jgi:hypothetical protein